MTISETELDSIQTRLGLVLPQRYRAVVLDYPKELLDMADVYRGPKKTVQRVGPENSELYAYAELLEIANLADVEHKNSIFPHHFFVIGDTGCGDYFAIDTSSDNAPVFMSGPHFGEYGERPTQTPTASTIDEYVSQIARSRR